MLLQKIYSLMGFTLIFSLVLLYSCGQQEEVVDLKKYLPDDMMADLQKAYPEFKLTLVDIQTNSNVVPKFNGKFMSISGIQDPKDRNKMAYLILPYLENPDMKNQDNEQKEEFEKLKPDEKLNTLISKVREQYPDFNYEWVEIENGNTKVKYNGRTLKISGIDDENTRYNVALGIGRIQKEIDESKTQ